MSEKIYKTYRYNTNTGLVEIEVEEEWVNVLKVQDKLDYNVDHRETRRHCSFDLYNREGNEVASDANVENEFFRAEDNKKLYDAISQLNSRQQCLIEAHYLRGRSQTEIAEEEGISPQAVHQTIERALKKLKKILNKTV